MSLRGTRCGSGTTSSASAWENLLPGQAAQFFIPSGATFNSPERVTIANPPAGRWTAVIVGFTIFGLDGKPDDPDKTNGRIDLFTFQATAEGKMLEAKR